MEPFQGFGKYLECLTHIERIPYKSCATFSGKCGSSNFLAYVIPIASVCYIQHVVHYMTNLTLEAVLCCLCLKHQDLSLSRSDSISISATGAEADAMEKAVDYSNCS